MCEYKIIELNKTTFQDDLSVSDHYYCLVMFVFDCEHCLPYKSILNFYITKAHTHKLICKPIKVMRYENKITHIRLQVL